MGTYPVCKWVSFSLMMVFISIQVSAKKGHHRKNYVISSRSLDELEEDLYMKKAVLEKRGMELPDLSSLLASLGSETKTGTQYEFGGCVIEIAKDQCKITFLPKKDSCHDQLSLGKLFDRFFPKGRLKTLFKEYVPVGVFQIERFVLDKCIGDLEFESIAKEAFNIIKEKLRVKKGKLNLSFNYKEFLEAPSFEKLGLDIRGEIELMEKVMPITLNKKRDSAEGLFSLKVESLKASDFVALFTKKAVTDTSAPEETSMFTNAVIEEPLITGSRDVDGGFEFIVKGHVKGIKGLGRITLFVIAQKEEDQPTSVAVVADIKKVRPTALLSAITGKDLNSIPIIKDITANLAVEFATSDIVLVKDPEVNKLLAKYVANAKTIAAGTKIKVELPIKKILTNINTPSSLNSVPENLYIQMFLHDGKVCFKFPDNITMDILNILTALLPKIPDILFSKILKTPPKVIIKKFDVNVATKYVDMMLVAPEDIVLGSNLVKITGAKFVLKHEINGPWDFRIEASKMIGNSTLDVSVNTEGDKYIFNGKIEELTTRSLAAHFGSKESSEGILSKMDFLNFGLRELSVSAVFGERLIFRIKANPVFFNFKGTYFEGFIIDTDNGRKMAFAVLIKRFRVDEFVFKLFKKKVLQCQWMNELTASVTVSNADSSKEFDFSYPELKKLVKLRKGVYFNTVLTIPEDCKGETLCEICKEKMKPGTKLYLEGELTSTGFQLRAGYHGNGLTFGKDLVLINCVIVVSIGVSTEFYVEGEVKMKDPAVTFIGKLGIGVTGKVELSLKMVGMWKRPFSMNYIAFGNLQLAVAVQPGIPLPELEFTAEMHFGKIGNDKEIMVKTALGFSPINPTSFYFYGEVNKLTLGSIAEAFGFSMNLPKVAMDIGFPDGLTAGFTLNPKGKTIEHMNVELRPGFMLKGTISILGMRLKCDILIHFPKSIKISVEMSPLSIGNVLKLRRKANDLENGPKLYVAMSQEEVAVQIMAYAELLGIGTEVVIDVSNKGIKFYVYGNLFDLIEANVTVQAAYGKGNLIKSQFVVSSCISASISDIQSETTEVIDSAAKHTEKVLDKSKDEIGKAASWHSTAQEKFDKWEKKMKEKNDAIQRKSRKLDLIKDFLDEDCVDKCDDICLGGPSIKRKCKKILGRWVSCPEWDDCKNTIENPACLAKCKGKKVYLEGKALKKKITMEILSDAIAIIRKILEMAKNFVGKSKGLIDFAERTSKKVESAVESGKEALAAIARYTKEHLINIHYLCFNTTLEKAETACFGVKLDVTLFGNKRFTHDADVCFDVGFIKNTAQAISDKIFPGITSIKDKISDVKNYFKEANKKQDELKEIEQANEVEEKDLEGKLEGQKLEDDDDDDGPEDVEAELDDKNDVPVSGENLHGRKGTVHIPNHSRSERYIRHQIYGDFPEVLIQDDLTLDAFETRSPWSYSRNDSPFTTKNEVNMNEDEVSEQVLKGDVPLELDNLEDPDDTSKCGQTTSVINTYSMISDTLALIEQKLTEEKHRYKADAQRFQKEIAQTEKYITEKCKKGNISEERTEDALFYVTKMKTGIQQWMEDVNKQINLQDEESLNMWRKSFADIIKTNKGIDLQKFLEILDQASKETSKRHTIPHGGKFSDSINSASKIIHDLLTGPSGSLSIKKTAIERLQSDITLMRKQVQCGA